MVHRIFTPVILDKYQLQIAEGLIRLGHSLDLDLARVIRDKIGLKVPKVLLEDHYKDLQKPVSFVISENTLFYITYDENQLKEIPIVDIRIVTKERKAVTIQ